MKGMEPSVQSDLALAPWFTCPLKESKKNYEVIKGPHSFRFELDIYYTGA